MMQMNPTKCFKAILLLLLSYFIVACSPDVPTVAPNKAAEMLKNNQTVILDVRDQDERSESHIEGTLFIPLAQLENRMSELSKFKNSTIITQCRSGRRSEIAGAHLIEAGFTKVLNLEGGLLAWEKQKLPTVKGSSIKTN